MRAVRPACTVRLVVSIFKNLEGSAAIKNLTILATDLTAKTDYTPESDAYRAVSYYDDKWGGGDIIAIQQFIRGEWHPTGGSWHADTLLGRDGFSTRRAGDSIYIDAGQGWIVTSGLERALDAYLALEA